MYTYLSTLARSARQDDADEKTSLTFFNLRNRCWPNDFFTTESSPAFFVHVLFLRQFFLGHASLLLVWLLVLSDSLLSCVSRSHFGSRTTGACETMAEHLSLGTHHKYPNQVFLYSMCFQLLLRIEFVWCVFSWQGWGEHVNDENIISFAITILKLDLTTIIGFPRPLTHVALFPFQHNNGCHTLFQQRSPAHHSYHAKTCVLICSTRKQVDDACVSMLRSDLKMTDATPTSSRKRGEHFYSVHEFGQY